MVSGIHSREDFDRYLVAFNNNDTPVYTSFYADDAEMALGPVVLCGLDSIKDFFNTGRRVIAEHIAPEIVIMNDHAMAVTATITFTAKVDFTEVPLDLTRYPTNKMLSYNDAAIPRHRAPRLERWWLLHILHHFLRAQ